MIVSVAGWVAVSFGNFYSPGDRVQMGGVRGDVIDIGVLRTTLMEVGQWVNGECTMAGSYALRTVSSSRIRSLILG